MFDKFKQMAKVPKMMAEAKKIQNELDQIKHTEYDGDMQVTVSGTQQIVNLKIDGEDQEKLMKLVNRAMKEVQKKSARKMMEMGGGLGGLLGGMQ